MRVSPLAAELYVVQGQEVIYTSHIAAVASRTVGTAVAARLLCVDTSTSPQILVGSEEALDANAFAAALASTGSCEVNRTSVAAWACATGGLACDISDSVFDSADLSG